MASTGKCPACGEPMAPGATRCWGPCFWAFHEKIQHQRAERERQRLEKLKNHPGYPFLLKRREHFAAVMERHGRFAGAAVLAGLPPVQDLDVEEDMVAVRVTNQVLGSGTEISTFLVGEESATVEHVVVPETHAVIERVTNREEQPLLLGEEFWKQKSQRLSGRAVYAESPITCGLSLASMLSVLRQCPVETQDPKNAQWMLEWRTLQAHGRAVVSWTDVTEHLADVLAELVALSIQARVRPCPRCGSEDVVEIVYGLPGKETLESAKRGEIVLGGCIVFAGSARLGCRRCKHKWMTEEESGSCRLFPRSPDFSR